MLVVVEGRRLGGGDGEADAVGVLEARALGRLDRDGLSEVEGEVLAGLLLVREGHWRGAGWSVRVLVPGRSLSDVVPCFIQGLHLAFFSLTAGQLSSLPWTSLCVLRCVS